MSTHEPGFTLVEIMAAVAILALIAGIAFSVVFSAVKRSRYIDLDLQLRLEASSIIALVAEDLRGTYVREGIVPYFLGEDRFLMDIPVDRVGFLTSSVLPIKPTITSGSFGEVEYFTNGDKSEDLVLVRREQAPASAPYDEGGEISEVTDRLASFDLSYFDGEDWFDEWDAGSQVGESEGKLPRKIRVSLSLEEGGNTVSFTTVVAPVMGVGR